MALSRFGLALPTQKKQAVTICSISPIDPTQRHRISAIPSAAQNAFYLTHNMCVRTLLLTYLRNAI